MAPPPGENKPDGIPMPSAAQPLPGLVLMYDSTGRWRDAVPNIHTGLYGYEHQVGEEGLTGGASEVGTWELGREATQSPVPPLHPNTNAWATAVGLDAMRQGSAGCRAQAVTCSS